MASDLTFQIEKERLWTQHPWHLLHSSLSLWKTAFHDSMVDVYVVRTDIESVVLVFSFDSSFILQCVEWSVFSSPSQGRCSERYYFGDY